MAMLPDKPENLLGDPGIVASCFAGPPVTNGYDHLYVRLPPKNRIRRYIIYARRPYNDGDLQVTVDKRF